MVGGSTAALVDAKHAISSRLLLTRAMIVVTSTTLRRPLGVSTSAAGRATQARAAAGSVSPGS